MVDIVGAQDKTSTKTLRISRGKNKYPSKKKIKYRKPVYDGELIYCNGLVTFKDPGYDLKGCLDKYFTINLFNSEDIEVDNDKEIIKGLFTLDLRGGGKYRIVPLRKDTEWHDFTHNSAELKKYIDELTSKWPKIVPNHQI